MALALERLRPWPSQLDRLDDRESMLRQRSIEAIEASEDLVAHVCTIEPAIGLMWHLVHRDETADQDVIAVQVLTIRVVNDLTSSLKLLLAGYYQVAAMIQRDLIETIFLLEDFGHDRSQVAKWRTATDEERWKEFQPKKVRHRLDQHHKHTGKKRDAAYKVFSDLAGHPNPRGFAMLRRQGEIEHNCGPFFDNGGLQATLTELARHAVHGGEVIGNLFELTTREDREIQWAAFIAKLEWLERFWGQPYDRDNAAAIRAAIDRL